MNWGNTTATFRWNRVWTDQLSGNFSAIFSNYYYRYKSITDGMKFLWKSNIQSYQLKYDADYAVNNALHIESGLSAHVFTTMPGSISSWGILVMLFPTGWTGGLYWIWQPMEKRLIKFHRHGS